MTKTSKTLLLSSAFAFAGTMAGLHPAYAVMRVPAAPELDPSSALAALTLLSGSLAIARGRWGKKK